MVLAVRVVLVAQVVLVLDVLLELVVLVVLVLQEVSPSKSAHFQPRCATTRKKTKIYRALQCAMEHRRMGRGDFANSRQAPVVKASKTCTALGSRAKSWASLCAKAT